MCFGGGGGGQQASTPAPAPAPPPPAPIAERTDITAPRKAEDKALYGANGPTTRVDRSLSSGTGGTGIRM